jgi:serine/threonine-protein kinase RsbW/stage II sporulation protein AB (anti-sigma F factor)
VPIPASSPLHDHRCAHAGNIGPLRREVVAFAAENGASADQCENVALAVNEALTNAVLHAYTDRVRPGEMTVDASMTLRLLNVLVSDDGVGMLPRGDSPGMGLGVRLMGYVSDGLDIASGPATAPGLRVHMTFALN